ncbi:MAG: type II toxin-antitoxin system PemK/MazF family toxin [Chlamydiae bacterium]|nr:type II toxin-antitoxin system PemK/MazF family toxin [Chlamydiota bacterium]MBI3266800.1 type II toxin-antitoxin system PemK/MazF family toxin [Chlamydiota bacterium]
MLRGDIYWADLEPTRGREQAGHRPVLIISNEMFNSRSELVIVLAITSQPQKIPFPLTYELEEKQLPKPSWVKIGQIRTLSVKRLGQKLSNLGEEEVNRIIEGLLDIVGP